MARQLGAMAGAALLALVGVTPACGRTETAMDRKMAAAEEDVANGGRGLAKLNPTPKKAVEFTLHINDAPGPFAVVVGGAQYDVINEDECGSIHPVAGTASRMTSQEVVKLVKVADVEYRGTVYLDLMHDEDYFGRGVCRWEFTGAGARLKATGTDAETRFLFFMERDRLVTGEPQVTYYANLYYPRAGIDNFPALGYEDRSKYKEEIQDELFTISMAAHKNVK